MPLLGGESKYRIPLYVPSFLPTSLSSSIPTHIPSLPKMGPINLTIPLYLSLIDTLSFMCISSLNPMQSNFN
ncbi:hypothetical protein A0H76_2397 [Hepatospora eriocheir]|uniref:Uncharacterized protein n=1 Tax=Hepatospora eriocheir TaxID=1081669 RepID=A0A1X0QFR3_9MICR|nr:hypothetical protein A0H76_2397 [Hepatospora eriocheir]